MGDLVRLTRLGHVEWRSTLFGGVGGLWCVMLLLTSVTLRGKEAAV